MSYKQVRTEWEGGRGEGEEEGGGVGGGGSPKAEAGTERISWSRRFIQFFSMMEK